MEEIQDSSKQIVFDNLTYKYKGKTTPKVFIAFKDPLDFYKNIKEKAEKAEKALEKAEEK